MNFQHFTAFVILINALKLYVIYIVLGLFANLQNFLMPKNVKA